MRQDKPLDLAIYVDDLLRDRAIGCVFHYGVEVVKQAPVLGIRFTFP